MSQSEAISANVEVASKPAVPYRLLIVDDSRLQRRILCATLAGWGFDVTEAGSAEEALERCEEELPDIVLSDWVMPGMSGIEFCRRFRQMSGAEYGYFILLTSKSDRSEVAHGLDAGADDFLTKPVDSNELRARISVGERIIGVHRKLQENNRLVSATLNELKYVQDLLDKDLMEAKKLQQSLIRERHRDFDEGAVSLLLRSAGQVGGDLVGFFPADAGKLFLYALDVSGHGVCSALMTARLAGILSETSPDQNFALTKRAGGGYAAIGPSRVAECLNRLILKEIETEQYVTMALALVDLATGRVTVTQAGHPHPVVQRQDGSVIHTGSGGFPIGLIAGAEFREFELTLASGDRLMLLSDGVTECLAPDGRMLGEDGLSAIAERLQQVSGLKFFDALVWELGRFAGTEDFSDDVSGVLFEYLGPASARETPEE
ncbi:PP2C family protein-serine/threonine phosphatase [Marimonas sp. MJW-29]|uniref:PP2C family protein-serine/threonine phosphatase n=1 Tax=Sulfitobacter sediminis TaxID=3234186 RepID=A0ABV3RNK5_9RHOB